MKNSVSSAYSVVKAFLRNPLQPDPASSIDPANTLLVTPEEITVLIERADALRAARAHGREVFLRHPGDARSAHLGRGVDFEEVRAYQPGDDIRNMDWRTTARMGEPFLKVYREEHHPALHIMIDRGASMRFGTRARLKVTQAARAAIVIGVLESESQACVGGTLIDTEQIVLPCLPRQAGLFALARAACAPCPPLVHDAEAHAAAWRTSLRHAALTLPRGSRLLLLSDFHWLAASDAALLGHLAQLHDLAAIGIRDPAELALPDVGTIGFYDLERGVAHTLDTGHRDARELFAQDAAQRQQGIAAILRQADIEPLWLNTPDDPFTLFVTTHG